MSAPNNTNFACPNDINMLAQTDYRPNKALYTQVQNNNQFRLYMQRNAEQIRQQQLQQYAQNMNCKCEPRQSSIIQFNSSKLDMAAQTGKQE